MARRRILAAALTVVAVAGAGTRPVAAESALWTLVASPLVATTGVSTTFVLTARNEDPLAGLLSSAEIGCVVVDVPAPYDVEAAAVTGSSMGGSWVATVTGNRVQVRTMSGGDRLELLDWVRFTVRATPLAAGQLAWSARAYRDQGCTGTGALLGVPPLVLVTGPAATPTPVPTPAPTPVPTQPPVPTPSPVPAPRLTPLPSVRATLPPIAAAPLPSFGQGGGQEPPEPASTPRPPSSGSPVPAESPSAAVQPESGRPASGEPPADGGSSEEGAGVVPETGAPDAVSRRWAVDEATAPPIRLTLGPLGLLGGLDVWAVPGLVIGIPGLLIAIFALVQALGALAWLPAIRRLRDEGTNAPAR